MVTIGERVKIKIKTQGWSRGAAVAMEGMLGVVERIERGNTVLVRFDKPAPTWWTHQTPPKHFWFEPADLVVIS